MEPEQDRHMDIEDDRSLYGRIAPRAERTHHRTTSDGFVINQDTELLLLASDSTIQRQQEEEEEFAYDDEGSEYVFDETTGQAVRRVKKVSFAAEDERFVIERPGEVKGLGLSKLFSFGPPKPMKSLPGREKKTDADMAFGSSLASNQLAVPPVAPARSSPGRRSTSKEASPAVVSSQEATSPKAFMAAMTGGLLGLSRSPDPSRRETDASPTAGVVGSVFGSLLKRGGRTKTSSKPGSKTGSRTSSADRSSQDLGSEDNQPHNNNLVVVEASGGGAGVVVGDPNHLAVPNIPSSRGSNYDDTEDARSDSSLVHRLGLKKKAKPPKVQMADFDELFARGMARSAQLESEHNVNPFQSASSPGYNQ